MTDYRVSGCKDVSARRASVGSKEEMCEEVIHRQESECAKVEKRDANAVSRSTTISERSLSMMGESAFALALPLDQPGSTTRCSASVKVLLLTAVASSFDGKHRRQRDIVEYGH